VREDLESQKKPQDREENKAIEEPSARLGREIVNNVCSYLRNPADMILDPNPLISKIFDTSFALNFEFLAFSSGGI
jgi:hypothetical protein